VVSVPAPRPKTEAWTTVLLAALIGIPVALIVALSVGFITSGAVAFVVVSLILYGAYRLKRRVSPLILPDETR
jgi:uncharacterized membrane protein